MCKVWSKKNYQGTTNEFMPNKSIKAEEKYKDIEYTERKESMIFHKVKEYK